MLLCVIKQRKFAITLCMIDRFTHHQGALFQKISQRAKVCRYNWHSAGSLQAGHFHLKQTEAILLNSTQKLLWFEIIKMLTEV